MGIIGLQQAVNRIPVLSSEITHVRTNRYRMARTPQDHRRTTPVTYHSLYQESDLVVAIFRTALILLAVLAPLLGGVPLASRLVMQVSVLIAAAYNVVVFVLYWTRVRFRGQRALTMFLDLLFITTWVYLTWNAGPLGIGSPLFPFYYVVIIISALWFGVSGALLAAGMTTVLYLALVFRLNGPDPFTLIDALYRDIIYLYLVAIVTGYLVDTHKREREQWTRSQVLLAQYQERFRAAQEVYEMLVPAHPPQVPGLELAARWRPALQEGGGDFYDVISLGPHRIAITIADVSGKYTRGALKLPLFKAAFLAAAQVWEDPGEVLAHVNRIVFPFLQPDMFISASVLVIDQESHRLLYANAGQDPPVFVRNRTRETVLLGTGGIVLGVDERASYPTETQALEPGDTLCLYTDGITETRNPQSDEFGYENLEARVQAGVGIGLSAEAIAENIYDAVLQYSRGLARRDDMTLLVARYRPETRDETHTVDS